MAEKPACASIFEGVDISWVRDGHEGCAEDLYERDRDEESKER